MVGQKTVVIDYLRYSIFLKMKVKELISLMVVVAVKDDDDAKRKFCLDRVVNLV